jgi:hypothetical protein
MLVAAASRGRIAPNPGLNAVELLSPAELAVPTARAARAELPVAQRVLQPVIRVGDHHRRLGSLLDR